MSTMVDERLRRLRSELDDHSRIADRLGLDLERPLRSLNDGYPENAVALVGKLTEKLLKELWRHHDVEGDPATKALNDLVKRCRPYIRSSTVLDALDDIRRLRNRSTHDGYDISDEDGLLAVRRLVDVLVWFTDTGSAALLGGEPDMAPEVARRCECSDKVLRRIEAIPIGGGRFDLPEEHQLDCHKRLDKKNATASYGRIKWDFPSPTMTTRCTTPACGTFVHPEEHRGITLREAATLQTFPHDYDFQGDYGSIERQIGNAVPVRMATVLGTAVRRIIGA